MSGTLVMSISLVAALGVFIAAMSIALPRASSAPDAARRWELPQAAQASLQGRINQPIQALLQRTNRSHRLNGGLTLAENLARADIKLRTSEFVMIQIGFMLAASLLSLWRFGFAPQFVIAGVIAYLLPMRFVKWRQRRRLKAFNSRLPDTISLLSNAMKAGLSLPQAIESVAQNGTPPISDELARVVRETKLGSSTTGALANMVRRVGSEDLDLIVTAITIQATVGGNLARVLDSISHTIRQRVQVKAQIGAMTAQMRASGWIITLLPFIVAGVLNVITPSYFRIMFTDPAGRVLLGLAGLSILIGNLFVRRITNFKV
jgi:tight adherence protein B